MRTSTHTENSFLDADGCVGTAKAFASGVRGNISCWPTTSMDAINKPFRSCAIWLTCVLLLVIARSAAADSFVIDTIGAGGLSHELVGNFGEPNASTVGQTFIAPAGRLESFTFYLFHDIDSGPARFKGYVSAWDGEKPTGPLLYTSGERQVTTALTAVPVTFDTGALL